MLTGILIISIVGFLGVLSHRRSRLENKIYKNVPLSDWIIVMILPIILYLGWYLLVKSILERPTQAIFFLDDFDILAITILFMVYGFVGNGIHFTGKILWRSLRKYKNSHAYIINEMFHGKLSHYLVYLNALLIVFMLGFIEINHPLSVLFPSGYQNLIVLSGIIFGYTGSKAIFYTNEWFGGYNKPLFFITSILLIFTFSVHRFYSINYSFYPVNLFVVSMGSSFISVFVLRQLIIFSKLGARHRFRFLAKIFSA